MKIIFVGFVSGVTFILLNISEYHVADGQYFPDPSKYFVPFEFDTANRAPWNASGCLKDLLNCWEITKPDMLCSYSKYKESICSFWKDNCDDKTGQLDNPGDYSLFENMCQENYYQEWTK